MVKGRNISADVGGGLSGVSRLRRQLSEKPHCCEQKFLLLTYSVNMTIHFSFCKRIVCSFDFSIQPYIFPSYHCLSLFCYYLFLVRKIMFSLCFIILTLSIYLSGQTKQSWLGPRPASWGQSAICSIPE